MTMRSVSTRWPWLAMFGSTLLIVSLLLALGGRGPVRLTADVLARSWGSGQGNQTKNMLCNNFNLNFPCLQAGAACATCSIQNYLDVRPGGQGKETNNAGAQNCGWNLLGTCDVLLTCIPNNPQTTLGGCQFPPAVIDEP